MHYIIIRRLIYFLVILLLASCGGEKPAEDDKMPSLYLSPRTVALNTREGYIINPVTGDSIRPIVNSFGDTIKTGVPVPAKGKAIHPDSVAQPKIVPVGVPKVFPTNLNIHKIPETLTIIPVNKEDLKTFTPGVDTSSFVLTNSDGDTIPTGVPIPTRGKIVNCIQPRPVKALPATYREDVTMNLKYLDMDNGMFTDQVISLMEDSKGNVWIGTWNGFSLYNGDTFIHYTEKEGLISQSFRSIIEDRKGNIWFGTGGGVTMYNGDKFIHYTTKEGLIDNSVNTIIEDRNGNIWFGTRKGVSMYNGLSLTHFTMKEGLINNNVNTILEDKYGNLWFGTYDGGVSIYDGHSFIHFTTKEGLIDNWVKCIIEDKSGNIWIGTNRGVSIYDGKSFTNFTSKDGLGHDNVNYIMEDRDGNIWLGNWVDRETSGVSVYDGKTFNQITVNEGLSSNYINSIMEDRSGNIWFATYGGGITIYCRKSFTHITEKEGLGDNTVLSIDEDSDGAIWIGGNGVLSKKDVDSFTHFSENEGLMDTYIMSILSDSQGNLWVGTLSGVNMYNGKTFTHFTNNEGLSSRSVGRILEDSRGNIWFVTGGGVSMYNGDSFQNYSRNYGLISNRITSIVEDRGGNLWFGTLDGVSMFDGHSVICFTMKEGLISNDVSSIIEDKTGNIWIGTEYGLSIYNGTTFTQLTTEEGLNHNYIISLIEDNRGNIWVNTFLGLNMIEYKDVNGYKIENNQYKKDVKAGSPISTLNNYVIHAFTKMDGLKRNDFFKGTLLDSKNRIWWGHDKGLTMLDMNNFELPSEPPVLELNRIEIGEQFLDYHNLEEPDKIEFDSVSKFYNYPINLKLPYSLNHLTFFFSAIDWSAPHKIKYTYKLDGLDDNWSIPTSEPKADYRNLPYGSHTLKVSAIGESQEWSTPLEYTFTINPPWWQTWWARAGYLISAVLLVIIYVNWRTRKLKQRQKVLEQKVKERTSEIQQQKEVIEDRNKKITDSIQYAKVIQDSILIKPEELEEVIPESFVYFKPRDIVSGDFYWITRQKECVIIAAVDCTGHGVPGGFMSMIGNTLLNLIVKERGIIKPSDILDNLNVEVIKALQQENKASLSQDGMDIAVCTIDYNNEEIQFSGAKNPLLMIIDNKLQIFKADPFSIGGSLVSKKKRGQIKFNNQVIKLTKGASLYLFSDGYVDQFGGTGNKSYNTSRLSDLLLSVSKLTPPEQYRVIESSMNDWMGANKQIDDMLIIGIKL